MIVEPRVGGLFSGIGAHHSAISNLGLGKVVFQAEFDRETARAYNLLHGETKNLGDITQVESLSGDLQTDILFWTPPCQDISLANRHPKGNDRSSGTRSSLAYEVPRILRSTPERERPTYLVFEEVPMMISPRYMDNFKEIISELESLGYASRYAVLNAKDYGIAQFRRRVFMISSLNRIPPDFPKKVPLDKVIRDYLEDGIIPEKYYLPEDRIRGLIRSTEKEKARGNGFNFNPSDGDTIAHTITTCAGQRKIDNFIIERPNCVGKLSIKGYDCLKRVYSIDACSPTIPTGLSGNSQIKILCDPNKPRVRKLTPKECLRLMGYPDCEINSLLGEFSDTALYKFAGNSVCVNVYTEILKLIFKDIKRKTRAWEHE